MKWVLNLSPVVLIVFAPSSNFSVCSFLVMPSLMAEPNTRFLDCPTKTSPTAPTYSGESLVEISSVRVVSVVHALVVTNSRRNSNPREPVASTLASSILARPTPLEITTFCPPSTSKTSLSFSVNVTFNVLLEVWVVPCFHHAFDAEPGGSRSTISTSSGPSVMKSLPRGSEPKTIALNLPFSLQFIVLPPVV